MTQRSRVVLGVLAILAILGVAYWVKTRPVAPAGRLVVAGNVRSDIRTITAPTIVYPTPDYAVGIPAPAGATQSGAGTGAGAPAKRVAGAAASGRSPVVAGTLARVYVREGDVVKAGDVVARFDTKLLALGVTAAKADAARTKTNVRLLNNTLDDLVDAKQKLATARASAFVQVNAGIATAKAQLFEQHEAAVEARPMLVAGIAALQRAVRQLPPNSPKLPALRKQLAMAQGQLAGIDSFLKQFPKIKRTFEKQTASAKAKATATINSKIGSAASKIRKAERQVKDARAVLRIIAKNSHIGVDLASLRRTQADVISPVSGVVTFARRSGTVAIVGAPLVRVRADGPTLIDTYLTAEQVPTIALGAAVNVTFDSSGGKVMHGKVSVIGSSYAFPPTSFPTQVVHMTRTVKATIALDPGSSAPPGTPVDLSIQTNSAN